MAVTGVSISQDNKNGNVNLFSIHNPLIFLIEAEYTGTAPDVLYAELQDSNSNVLGTFRCIPFSDVTGIRTFAFIANKIIKSYMNGFDDFVSEEKVLEVVPDITEQFTIRFYDETDTYEGTITFIAIHAVRQFGENPALSDIYDNDDDVYYGAVGMPIYLYIYNNNSENVITVDTPSANTDAALDYDDVVFVDQDDVYFKLE